MYKQMQDHGIDKLNFEIISVPSSTKVPLDENRKLEQNAHYILRVPIQPGVQ